MPIGGTVPCVSCGQPVSRYASRCPRCGAPQPHKRIGSSVGLAGLLLLLVVVLVWAIFS